VSETANGNFLLTQALASTLSLDYKNNLRRRNNNNNSSYSKNNYNNNNSSSENNNNNNSNSCYNNSNNLSFQIYPDAAHSLMAVRPHLYLSMEQFFGSCFHEVTTSNTFMSIIPKSYLVQRISRFVFS